MNRITTQVQAYWALAGLLGLWVVLQGSSPEAFAVIQKADARNAVSYFLDLDCAVTTPRLGTDYSALERILRLSLDEPEVELRLLTILREGPNKHDIERVRAFADEEWSRLKDFLLQYPDCCGLKEEDRHILKSLLKDNEESKKSFVDQTLERLTRKHKERAAVALTAIAARGSEEADRAIREAENAGDKNLKAVIAAARKEFEKLSEKRTNQ